MKIELFDNINAIDFEEFVRDCFNQKYNTHTFELYGTKGQAQSGIDIYSQELQIAVQCKYIAGKRVQNKKSCRERLKKYLDNESQKARESGLSIQSYYLVSTFDHDKSLIEYASERNRNCSQKGKGFVISYLGREELIQLAKQSPNIINRYFPMHVEAFYQKEPYYHSEMLRKSVKNSENNYWKIKYNTSNEETHLELIPKMKDSFKKDPQNFRFNLDKNAMDRYKNFLENMQAYNFEFTINGNEIISVDLPTLIEPFINELHPTKVSFQKLPIQTTYHYFNVRVISKNQDIQELKRIKFSLEFYTKNSCLLKSIDDDAYYPITISIYTERTAHGNKITSSFEINTTGKNVKASLDAYHFSSLVNRDSTIEIIDSNTDKVILRLKSHDTNPKISDKYLEFLQNLNELQKMVSMPVLVPSNPDPEDVEFLKYLIEAKLKGFSILKNLTISLELHHFPHLENNELIIMSSLHKDFKIFGYEINEDALGMIIAFSNQTTIESEICKINVNDWPYNTIIFLKKSDQWSNESEKNNFITELCNKELFKK